MRSGVGSGSGLGLGRVSSSGFEFGFGGYLVDWRAGGSGAGRKVDGELREVAYRARHELDLEHCVFLLRALVVIGCRIDAHAPTSREYEFLLRLQVLLLVGPRSVLLLPLLLLQLAQVGLVYDPAHLLEVGCRQ